MSAGGISSRSISPADMKVLWGLAAGRCSFPDCRTVCVAEASVADPSVPLGEMAHIVGHSDDGPRGDAAYPKASRGTYDNLILLCPTHHTRVDKQENTHTVLDLRQWKGDHERWVQDRLAEAMPKVTFAELEIVTTGILAMAADPSTSFVITPPAAKMVRNGLSGQIRVLLQMGIAGASEVERFVNHVGALQPDFPERIKSGFVRRFTELRADGLQGDGLFTGLLDFAQGPSSDLARRTAGLAVLAYLFMKCEVFEP